mmetsp:Transcript_148088/g.258347  ORF Transcript_148088/g.258347 Transcript_148088/m.258347 type:complete len:208 (-) Transcript_148088:91-714(-)
MAAGVSSQPASMATTQDSFGRGSNSGLRCWHINDMRWRANLRCGHLAARNESDPVRVEEQRAKPMPMSARYLLAVRGVPGFEEDWQLFGEPPETGFLTPRGSISISTPRRSVQSSGGVRGSTLPPSRGEQLSTAGQWLLAPPSSVTETFRRQAIPGVSMAAPMPYASNRIPSTSASPRRSPRGDTERSRRWEQRRQEFLGAGFSQGL